MKRSFGSPQLVYPAMHSPPVSSARGMPLTCQRSPSLSKPSRRLPRTQSRQGVTGEGHSILRDDLRSPMNTGREDERLPRRGRRYQGGQIIGQRNRCRDVDLRARVVGQGGSRRCRCRWECRSVAVPSSECGSITDDLGYVGRCITSTHKSTDERSGPAAAVAQPRVRQSRNRPPPFASCRSNAPAALSRRGIKSYPAAPRDSPSTIGRSFLLVRSRWVRQVRSDRCRRN